LTFSELKNLTCSVDRFFDEVLLVAVDGDGLDAADEIDRRQLARTIQDGRLVGYSAEVHVVVVEHQRAAEKKVLPPIQMQKQFYFCVKRKTIVKNSFGLFFRYFISA
jgi:hypothetical protein